MSSGEKEEKRISRRDFVRGAAVGAAGVAAASVLTGCAQEAPASTPEVIKETVEVPVEVIKEVEVKPWLPEKWDYEADVVAVGFGAAGSAVAIEAADAGADVLLLEKMPEGLDGGNFGVCGGLLLSPATSATWVQELTFGKVDAEIVRLSDETEKNLLEWLESLGLTVDLITQYPGITFGWVAEKGTGLFAAFKEQVKQRGVNVLYETSGKELIQDPVTGEILGVKAESKGQILNIKARKGVVLTTGGYESNSEMLNDLNHPGVYIASVGSPGNTGDGLKMAIKAGARLSHIGMDVEWWSFAYRLPSQLYKTGITGTFPSNSYIFANKAGKRFMDEKTSLVHTKTPLQALHFEGELTLPPPPVSEYPNIPFFAVFDDKVIKSGPLSTLGTTGWNDVYKIYEWSADNSVELNNGWIVKADTVEELAAKMTAVDEFGRSVGVDSAGLVDTINKFNQDCASGIDSQFKRASNALAPLDTPPYYAIEMCLSAIYTIGGLKYNANAQVLNYDNKPIPRLYMVGMVGSCGIVLPFGGIVESFTFGRVAAKNAVSLEPWG